MSTVMSNPDISNCPPQQAKYDHSTTLAQLELFIKLGNMDDLDPNKHFAGIMGLGYALIDGDLAAIQEALKFYNDQHELLREHMRYLTRAFAHAGVTFLEPSILRQEGSMGQIRFFVVMQVMLERAGKIAFISSDQSRPSYVHAFTRNRQGVMTLEPAKEDPRLLLKQISRVIRIPDVVAPPPISHS